VNITSSLHLIGGNHAGVPGVSEYATGLNDRASIPDRLQPVLLAGGVIDQKALGELDRYRVAGLTLLTDSALRLQRVHLSGSHRVPEEDARVGLCHHRRDPRCAQRHRCVLAGRATSEVVAADDDGVLRLGLVGLHKARGVGGGEAYEGVGAELLVLGGLGGDEGEVLGGDDLVGVDVVADDVAEAVEGGGGCVGGRGGGRRGGGAWDGQGWGGA
jgi:hypothetical protein